jgi:hypothetical protein
MLLSEGCKPAMNLVPQSAPQPKNKKQEKRVCNEVLWAPTNDDNGGIEIIEDIDGFTTKNGNGR